MLIGTSDGNAYCLDDVNANSCGDGNVELVRCDNNNNDDEWSERVSVNGIIEGGTSVTDEQ